MLLSLLFFNDFFSILGFKLPDEQDFNQGDDRNVVSSPTAVAASTTEGKSAPNAVVFTASSSAVTQATNSNSLRIPSSLNLDRTPEQIETVNIIGTDSSFTRLLHKNSNLIKNFFFLISYRKDVSGREHAAKSSDIRHYGFFILRDPCH